jgi:DNA ligase-1
MTDKSRLSWEGAAEAFAQLEATSSRRTMVERIAELLRRAGRDGAARIAYLLQGRLRPAYESVEIGVGEKQLAAALAAAYDVSASTISRRLAQAGDLGLVAEQLAPEPRGPGLSLMQVYDGLLDVARSSGGGSVAGKRRLLVRLLHRSSSLGARYLVRVAQGRLRLGVGDQTILEAAALGALGDRRHKPLLEHAYNVRPDLGDLVRLAFSGGARRLTRIAPEPGIPVRPALAQRVASAEAIIARLGPVQLEPKYDGLRLQLHRKGGRVWVFSRRLENVTAMFPDLVAALRRQTTLRRIIMEGEAVVHNPDTGEFLPFQVTLTRKRKENIAEVAERYPVRLFAFDLLLKGRASCLPWPQRRRSRELRQVVRGRPDDAICVTDAIAVKDPEALLAYFDTMIERGLEGVMAKRPDAPYRPGARGFDWVKLKRAYQSRLRDTVDLVLVGYLRGRGKRATLGIGSLLGAVYDARHDRFRTVAKIGSGLTERGWRDLRTRLDRDAVSRRPARVDSLITPDVWVTPSIVVEVLADEITRSPAHTCGKVGEQPGYGLRFPRLLEERKDKAAEDATTEQEILRLQQLQRPARVLRRGAAKR